jgi:hypothetical protein
MGRSVKRGHFGLAFAVLAAASSADARPTGLAADAVDVIGGPVPSLQEELKQAHAMVLRIEQASATARRQLDSAREEHDIVKSMCLNDKLSQEDVAGRSAKDREAALDSAIKRGDTELANHEFTVLSILRQRVEQLSAEANQCVGEEIAFVGETQVTAQIDLVLPTTGDENGPEAPGGLGILPPPVIAAAPPIVSPTH